MVQIWKFLIVSLNPKIKPRKIKHSSIDTKSEWKTRGEQTVWGFLVFGKTNENNSCHLLNTGLGRPSQQTTSLTPQNLVERDITYVLQEKALKLSRLGEEPDVPQLSDSILSTRSSPMHNIPLKSTYALLYVVREWEPCASDLRQADG